MHTNIGKTLYTHSLRVVYALMILSMLLTAVGVTPVSAAPKDTAVQFDGTNDYVTFGSSAGTTTGLGGQVFTIETWFKRTGAGAMTSTGTGGLANAVPLVTKGRGEGDNSNLDMNYFFGIDTSNVLAADFEECARAQAGCPATTSNLTQGGQNYPVRGATVISNNVWYHGAVTFDGRYWKLYLNGVLETMTGADTGASRYPRWDSIQHAGIGTAMTSTAAPAGYFAGVTDEVRIWNVVRTQAEIQTDMSNELTSGTGLIGRWGLNEGTGTAVSNSIAGRPNGTLTNGPVWVVMDSTPPAAPTGLTATPYSGGVSLSWTANSEPDMSGYNLYRSATPGGPYTKVNISLIAATSTSDGGLTNGTTYYYVLKAVDTSSNESAASSEVSATPQSSYGSAVKFDGANDYATFGANLNASSFTLESWIKRDAGGATMSTGTNGFDGGSGRPNGIYPILTKGMGEGETPANINMNWFLGITATGVVGADFEDAVNGGNHPIWGSTVIPTGEWHHIAVTYTGSCWALYLDGNAETMNGTTCPNAAPEATSIQHAGLSAGIGSTGQLAVGYFAGTIDEARVWNVVRSQAEIQSAVNSELTGGTGLIGRWGMNEGGGTTIADSTAPTVNGTLTNGPTWVAGSPFNIAPPSPPAAPTLLAAIPTAGLQIDLTWTDNSNNETSFKVERSPDGSTGWTQIGTTASNIATYSNTGLDIGTQYCYRVRAWNGAGDSDYSNVSCATTPGEPNNSLYLGTNNAYVDVGKPAALGLKTFTIETWFKRTAAGTTSFSGSNSIVAVPLVTKGMAETESQAADVNYFFGIGNLEGNSTNKLVADFEECTQGQTGCQTGGTSGLNHPVVGNTTIAADGVWHHAAVTYDGQVWKLYLDGNLDGTVDVGAIRYPQFANDVKVALGTAINTSGNPGTSGSYGPGYFVGNLDETRIWNYARTQSAIQGAMDSAVTSPQTGLVARWGLNETTGTAVSSNAGTSVNGSITGTGSSWGPGAPAIVNHAPAFVSSTPTNGATGISTSPTLTANFSDADLDELTVQFYGRIKNAPPGPDFIMIAIPDPQYYAASYPSIYNAQMNWIVSNKTSSNIVYALSMGDNVDVSTNTTQWTNATTAYDILTAGGVQYGIEAGNHDGAPASTANFNANFATRKTSQSTYGGRYGTSDYDNYYTLFEASGMKFIAVFIEYDDAMTSTSNPVLVWANGVLQANTDRRAIVVTHNLLNGGTSTSFSGQGQAVYDALKGNPNLFLMLGGHLDIARHRTDTFNGNTVHSLRADYQMVDSQQSGYLRIMRFSPTNNNIYVSTYSPTKPGNYPTENPNWNEFSLPYAMTSTASYALIGTATAPAGTNASVTWNGLAAGTEYEWYAVAADASKSTTGATQSFTTQAGANEPPVITEGASTSVTMSEDGSPTAFSKTLNATDANVGDTLTWSISTPASHGTASASGTGTSKAITYAPTANYNGSDSFVVQVSDGNGGSDMITVNVTIQSVNDAPVTANDAYSVSEDTVLNVSATGLLTNDTDIESNPLTAIKVTDPANGSLTLNANGSFTYTPSANFNGPDTFTYKTYDGELNGNTATVTITVSAVNDAPVAVGDSYTTAEDTQLGVPNPGVLGNDINIDGDPLDVIMVDPASHGTASFIFYGQGAFSYTPALHFNGSDSFTYKLYDGFLYSNTVTVAINVTSVNNAPVCTSVSLNTAEDVTGQANPSCTDADGDTMTYSIVDPAASGTASIAAGKLSYEPNLDFHGSDSFTYRASDGTLDSDPATVNVTVSAVNDAPVLGFTANQNVDELALLSFTATATDVESDPLTFSLTGAPAGANITSGGAFTWTPNEAQGPNVYNFNICVNDGAASDCQNIQVTVVEINAAPALDPIGSKSVDEGSLLTFTATASDEDIPANSLTYSLSGAPAGASIDPNSGVFTWTPTEAQGPETNSFNVLVSDGIISGSETITVTINEANIAPVANSQTAATDENTDIAITLTASDADLPANPLTYIVGTPTHGALSGTAPALTYTPDAGYNGTDSFTFKVFDGTVESNLATVSITVAPINDAPVCADVTLTTNEDTTSQANPSCTDADGDPLTYSVVSQPTQGAASVAGGKLEYTPAANFNGADTFTYTANDGALNGNTATVTVTVNAVNDAPMAVENVYATAEDTELDVTAPGALGNDSDLDGDALTAIKVTDPLHGTLTFNADGSFTYMPAPLFNGADSFTYKAYDGAVESNVVTVTINVSSVNNAPACNAVSLETDEDTSSQADPSCADPDGNTLSLLILSDPAHGSASLAGGKFVYIPEANYFGVDSFTYGANDGGLDSNIATVSITVNSVNDAPVAVNEPYNTDENVTLTIAAPGVLTNDTDADNDPLTAVKAGDPAHGTLTLNANGSFTYIPNVGYTGDDTFTYTANDGVVGSAIATVTIHVNFVTPPNLPSSFYGDIHIFDTPPQSGDALQIFAPGASDPVATIAIGLSGPTLNYAVNVPMDISGTPAKEGGVEGDLLTFKIASRVVATGEWHSGTNVRLDIHPPQAIPGGPYFGDAGTAINFSGSANDYGSDVNKYQWDWDNDGVYETESQNTAHTWANDGTYTVGLKVTDAQGGAGTTTVTATVNNVAPVLNAIGDKSINELVELAFNATASDTDPLTFSLVGAPAGASITAGGAFTWTPTEAQGPGSYNFTVKVCDDGTPALCDEELITITVAEVSVTHSIGLVSGWNLISFNVHPDNTNISAVLSSISGNYDLVYAWDATGSHSSSGNWMKYAPPPAPVFSNTLNSLDETMGFWIHMTAADTLDVTGNAPATTTNINLSVNAGGWNLTAYPSVANRSLPGALSANGVGTDFSLIYAYHANNPQDPWVLFDRTGLPFANDLTHMAPGWGYWIKVNVNHSWSVKYLAD